MRRCADCKQELPEDQFTKSNPWYCRKCKNDRHKAWKRRKRDESESLRSPVAPREEKLCKRCGVSKPIGEFYTLKERWTYYFCKQCSSEVGRQRRELQISRGERAYERLKYRCNKFGISVDWYVSKNKDQGGVCALCKCPESNRCRVQTGELRGLSIDHDHGTGNVRGLLCFRCNTALHQLEKHGIGWADAAVAYLKKYEKETNNVRAQAIS